jgi:D-apiose dehydrogenase
MVEACRTANVPLMVHENFRFQSPIQAVSKILKSGEIGEPFWGRFSFRSGYDVFSGQPYLAKGKRFIIEDLGIHVLDIARCMLGDVASLTARTKQVNPVIAGEDVATILLDHESGATSMVDCSYATKLSKEPFPETLIELDGTEGSIRLHQGYRLEINGRNGHRIADVSPPLLSWASRPWHNIQESVLAIQQHWIECLKTGAAPATSGADNLKTFALVEAAYQSASSGGSVRLQDLLG